MYSWKKQEERLASARLNAELRHAQLELLSAQSATDQLSGRFSVEDLVRHGERDVLRKSISAATALCEYYGRIQRELPQAAPAWSEPQIRYAVQVVTDYLHHQRATHRPAGIPLPASHRARLQGFFSERLLDRVRTVELCGRRVPPPPFYAEARTMGLENLPELPHLESLTFVDVVVFNDRLADRTLFHGLVHAAQFAFLGVERYASLFVRGFLRTREHFAVPIESHVFALESRYAREPQRVFSVEEQVQLWTREGRY